MTATPTRCCAKRCHDGPPLAENGPPGPRYALTGTLLCRRCTDRLERNLAELPARLSLVRANLGGHTTPRRSERPAAGSHPSPLNVTAHDLLQIASNGGMVQESYYAGLWGWCRVVMDERDLRGPSSLQTAPQWLLGQLDWIVAQPFVDDLDDELHDLTVQAEALIRSRAHRHRLEAPCPTCNAYELGRWDGSSQVDCASCGRTWGEEHYPRLALVAAQASGGCMTAVEAQVALGVSYDAFRQIVSRRKVRKLATIDGTAFYAASDVEALRVEAAS